MRQRVDGWMVGLLMLLLGVALLACKKSKDAAPEASATAVVSASAAPAAPVDAGPPPLERYGTEEKEAKGKARVAVDELAVYPKAASSAQALAKLVKETEVERKARYQEFTLVEYRDQTNPSSMALGWVEDKEDPKSPVLRDIVLPKPVSSVVKQTVKPPPPSDTPKGRGTRSRPGNMR